MKNYKYNVNAYGEHDEATFRTNDVRDALDTFITAAASGTHTDLLDGYTGEVLALANYSDKDFATEEITLMIAGMLFEKGMVEPAPEAEENEPACGECGGPVNENGVCQHCGVQDDTLRGETDDPELKTIEPDDLFALIEQMVAEGKAVKLGGLPS